MTAPTLPCIPTPARFVPANGSCALPSMQNVTVTDPSVLPVVERFRYALAPLGGPSLTVELRAIEEPARVTHGVRADDGDVQGEAHRIVVGTECITVTAPTPEGVHRALTTLTQLAATGDGEIPCGVIDDAPEFAWRGLSLDVVRTFVPLDEVRRIIDILSLYKLNVLHLHLTDNEGWRLGIESWPHLTEIGAAGATGDRPGGFYTQAEFRDLVAYARERFVTVVPEIDMPGHCGAAIRAYPELSGDSSGASEGAMNLDPESATVWRFVTDVLGEVAALSPARFLHVGGDEAFGMADDAHAAFVSRAIRIGRGLGKRVVGWQEFARGDIGRDEVAQYWIDFAAQMDGTTAAADSPFAMELPPEIMAMIVEHFGKAAGDLPRVAERGASLLLSPNRTAYLDRPHGDPSVLPEQDADRTRLGLQVYPASSLEDMLDWSPFTAAPGIPPAALAGVEAAMWCETVEAMDDLELLVMPRLPGIAQVAWSPAPTTTWDGHRARLAQHSRLWERAGWNWYRADSVEWPDLRASRRPR